MAEGIVFAVICKIGSILGKINNVGKLIIILGKIIIICKIMLQKH